MIKATELQIGDWYEWHPDAIPSQRHYERVTAKTFGFPKRCFEAMNPVPLIPEILEKNGFVYNKNMKRYEIRKPHIEVVIYQNEDDGEIYGFYITYTNGSALKCREYEMTDLRTPFTHELQHALRLCGLEELADGFKI